MKKSTLRAAICILLIIAAIGCSAAGKSIDVKEPMTLTDGQSLKAIYFFPHWWDPWKSDDATVTADLKKMSSLGLNTVCLDHEASQALDKDWFWLDREFKLVGQEKMYILPWLQLHSVDRLNLMKFSHLPLKAAVNQDKVVEEDCIQYRDEDFRHALARYISAYLDRYKSDPALLRINWGGQTRPVIGTVLEIGWRNASGMPLSFDDDTNTYFRKWMKSSYRNLADLNRKWGTSYRTFDEIDPCDKTIFNYNFEDKNNMPVAVKEHVKFRARMINDAFDAITREVRKRHKDVLFAAETAYPFSLDNPEAKTFKWNDANEIRAINFADIICIRTMGNTSMGQVKKDQENIMLSGKKVMLSYRFFPDTAKDTAAAFALDCSVSGNALGYYSWNETADNTSSIYNKPDQQDMLRTMCDVYDLLNKPSKRQVTAPTTPVVVEPVAPVVPVAPIVPAPIVPAPVVTPVEPVVPVAPVVPVPVITPEPPQPAPVVVPEPVKPEPKPVPVVAPKPKPVLKPAAKPSPKPGPTVSPTNTVPKKPITAAKPVVKPAIKPAVKSTVKPVVKTALKPAAKPTLKTSAKTVTKPIAKKPVKPAAKTVSKPVVKKPIKKTGTTAP
ncbi:MAG: beta-galactosidase [Armatimonadota bacterium]